MPHQGTYDHSPRDVASPFVNYMTLATAMVERAVDDVQEAREYIEGDLFWREDDDKVTRGKRAWHWLTMPQTDERISFAFLCDAMGVDIDHAQDKLLHEVPDRIIDILERQIVLRVRKQQPPRKERKHAGAKQTGGRVAANRRREGNGGQGRRRQGSAGG